MAENKTKTRTRKRRVKPRLADVVAEQSQENEVELTPEMAEPKVEEDEDDSLSYFAKLANED